jgi:hypothetical protein
MAGLRFLQNILFSEIAERFQLTVSPLDVATGAREEKERKRKKKMLFVR